ncbi:hypothetical protein V6Z11_D11G341400 [Gossypium hirsutum]
MQRSKGINGAAPLFFAGMRVVEGMRRGWKRLLQRGSCGTGAGC